MSNIIDTIRLSGTDYTLSATSSGGNPTVELTQAEYDALVSAGTVSADTYYIITDAQAGDLSQYWTSAQTNSAITQAVSGKVDTTTFNTYSGSVETALSGKQDTLVSGTNIKTINNESILGSGNIDIQGGGGEGKSVEAGRGISVASGDSAYTVSFNLAISAGTYDTGVKENHTGNKALRYAHAEGGETSAMTYYCHTEGEHTITKGTCWASHAEGYYTEASNYYEHASGYYNVSNRASSTLGDSGNTLFSVGNGTADNSRHNAFEIRQNGDIYLSSGGTDIKLQDHLGGGGSSYTAGDGIDITNDVISVTGKVDTTTFNTYSGNVETSLSGKQDTLSAGTGIDITNNVISVTGMVATSSIATVVTSSSTDSEVPSAKCLYDALGDIETLLSQI